MDQDDIVDVLNDLIENCRDGQYGFQACAEHVKSADIRDLFLARANDCQAAVTELQTLVSQCGGKPDEGGSMSGAVHRGWVAVRGTLAGYTDLGMLEECERGEDSRTALAGTHPDHRGTAVPGRAAQPRPGPHAARPLSRRCVKRGPFRQDFQETLPTTRF